MQGRNLVVKVYEPVLKQAGIEGATWHTLRHTFAPRAVMAGVDIRTVQELMGHSTITMTMCYAHLSPAHLREAVNKASLGRNATGMPIETGSKTGSEIWAGYTLPSTAATSFVAECPSARASFSITLSVGDLIPRSI